jgi:hypothetical protein
MRGPVARPAVFQSIVADIMNPLHRLWAAPWVVAACLPISPVWAQTATPPAAAASAAPVVRNELVKPLQAAQEALKADKPQEALAKLAEAGAVPNLSAYEAYIIERTRAVAHIAAKDTPAALASFAKVFESAALPAAERLPLMESVAGLAYRSKDAAASEQWSRRYFASGGTADSVRSLLIYTLLDKGDYAGLLKELTVSIAGDDAAGRPVNETKLQILAQSTQKLGQQAAYRAALERLVGLYPKTDYWAATVSATERQEGFPSPRLDIDVLRLARQVGVLSEGSGYVDMAQLALSIGQPAEAASVMEEGYSKGLLGQGKDAASHAKMRAAFTKAAADDRAGHAAAQANVAKAKDGGSVVALGLALVNDGQTEVGLTLMAKGIAQGVAKFPEDAALRYGVALLTHGQREKAVAVLQGVKTTPGAGDLARLWLLAVR